MTTINPGIDDSMHAGFDTVQSALYQVAMTYIIVSEQLCVAL